LFGTADPVHIPPDLLLDQITPAVISQAFDLWCCCCGRTPGTNLNCMFVPTTAPSATMVPVASGVASAPAAVSGLDTPVSLDQLLVLPDAPVSYGLHSVSALY